MLKKYILQVILIVLVISKTGYCQYYELPQTSAKDHVFKYSAYTVLYNTTTNTPRWVAWTFSSQKRSNIQVSFMFIDDSTRTFSSQKRSNIQVERSGNKFLPDPNLGSASPTHNSYTNSGYDRGHMCPANDCLWSGKALDESFYMSNVCPQTPELNRARGRKGLGSAWRIVEDKCDGPWADKYKMLYIVAGPIPNEIRGTITIEDGKSILVPKRFFKAIVGVDKNGQYHGIGFIFTQECAVQIVSIDEVERQACLDLFYQIPQRIQNKIEQVSSFSESDWPGLSVIK